VVAAAMAGVTAGVMVAAAGSVARVAWGVGAVVVLEEKGH
jgi:hypothetical protein